MAAIERSEEGLQEPREYKKYFIWAIKVKNGWNVRFKKAKNDRKT